MGRGEADIPLLVSGNMDLVGRGSVEVRCFHAVSLVAEGPLAMLMEVLFLKLPLLRIACERRGEESNPWSAGIGRGIVIPSCHGVGYPL